MQPAPALNLDADLPLLLVFGGSRGAHSINQALLTALPQLLPICQVVHISGQLDWPAIGDAGMQIGAEIAASAGRSDVRYHPYPYLHDEMVQALAAADLVIARAGASVLGEFPAVGLPSILAPYPYAGQHQDANAAYLADRGAALVVPDGELANRLAPTVLGLFTEPERLAAYGNRQPHAYPPRRGSSDRTKVTSTGRRDYVGHIDQVVHHGRPRLRPEAQPEGLLQHLQGRPAPTELSRRRSALRWLQWFPTARLGIGKRE